MRLVKCETCGRAHPIAVGCAVCKARKRVDERYERAVGRAAYDRLAQLMDAAPGTPEAVELDNLATLISIAEIREKR